MVLDALDDPIPWKSIDIQPGAVPGTATATVRLPDGRIMRACGPAGTVGRAVYYHIQWERHGRPV